MKAEAINLKVNCLNINFSSVSSNFNGGSHMHGSDVYNYMEVMFTSDVYRLVFSSNSYSLKLLLGGLIIAVSPEY